MEEIRQLNRKLEETKPIDLNYRIGLDIGITSVGWAVLENKNDEPFRIIDLGVRIFKEAEQSNGDPLALPRRKARSARRRTRRRRFRLERIKKLFQTEGLIDIKEFEARYEKAGLPDVYRLRYEGLDRKLTDDELAQILLHIAKHRGFKSNSKAEETENENDDTKKKEAGAIKDSISNNKKIMEEKGYRTVGEMLYLDEKFKIDSNCNTMGYVFCPRNKQGDYKVIMLRDMLVDEVHAIFEAQRNLDNTSASDELEKKYLDIMLSQRSFDQGPGAPSQYAIDGFDFGTCTLEKANGEKRAPKAAYTSELFIALQKINNTRIVDKDGNIRNFSDEERWNIIRLIHKQQEVKYSSIRNALCLSDDEKFYNLTYSKKKDSEQSVFIKMVNYHSIRKALKAECSGELLDDKHAELYDNIAYYLTKYKNDDSRLKELKNLGIGEEKCNNLINLSCTKTQNLSFVAMKKIIPFLLEGKVYSEACKMAGYNNSNEDSCADRLTLLKGEKIKDAINEISNPVVRRAVSQTIKVLNAIILEYGSPQAINIELSREMAKNRIERDKIDKDIKNRNNENQKILDEIREFKPIPSGKDIVKYRLWKEQKEICLYTGKKISAEELFASDGGYDIDHILPYSKTFDDSYRNKVLVRSEANKNKGNRTPYEYLISQGGEKAWEEFTIRIEHNIKDYKKRQKLLKKHVTDEETNEFKRRNLQDTQYATTFIYNLIRQNLYLKPYQNLTGKKKQQVMALNGAVTHYLSKRWGFESKDRRIDTHHAQDAVVIACTTQGMINTISNYSKFRELELNKINKSRSIKVDELSENEFITREQYDKNFGVEFPLPWDNFKEELDIRMSRYHGAGDEKFLETSPREYIQSHSDVSKRLDYPKWMFVKGRPGRRGVLDGIFVSRMPNHKVTGQAHEETIRSAKYYKDGGCGVDKGYIVYKTALTNLKLDKNNEIANYFNPESDKLLYNALVEQLKEYGNDSKKAFEKNFYKPKADGSKGPVVKKVKVFEKKTTGVYLKKVNGFGYNDSMIRADIYYIDGKYYFVPVYVSDTVKNSLPNQRAAKDKNSCDWEVVSDDNFLFSLYKNDLLFMKNNKLPLKSIDEYKYLVPDSSKGVFMYFCGADVSGLAFKCESNDKTFNFRSSITTIEQLCKCQVDVLGNISFVNKEKRMPFN
jgi:CRISPR-associated endonuclease Csn1